MVDTTPVMVSERHGRVSVLMLLEVSPDQLAPYGDWFILGQIVEVSEVDEGPRGTRNKRTTFQWYWDELQHNQSSGVEPTRALAIRALLTKARYHEASATIPSLIDL